MCGHCSRRRWFCKIPSSIAINAAACLEKFSGLPSWDFIEGPLVLNSIEQHFAALLFHFRTGPGSPALMSVFITHTHIFHALSYRPCTPYSSLLFLHPLFLRSPAHVIECDDIMTTNLLQEVAKTQESRPSLPRSGACASPLPAWHTHDAVMFGG